MRYAANVMGVARVYMHSVPNAPMELFIVFLAGQRTRYLMRRNTPKWLNILVQTKRCGKCVVHQRKDCSCPSCEHSSMASGNLPNGLDGDLFLRGRAMIVATMHLPKHYCASTLICWKPPTFLHP